MVVARLSNFKMPDTVIQNLSKVLRKTDGLYSRCRPLTRCVITRFNGPNSMTSAVCSRFVVFPIDKFSDYLVSTIEREDTKV
jgi:hypothetical protein